MLDDGIDSIASTVLTPGGPIRFFVTHTIPPMNGRFWARRNRHLWLLGQRIVDFRRRSPSTRVVVIGDLNLTPWSPFFADLTRQSKLRRAIHRFDAIPTHHSVLDAFPFGLLIDHALIDESISCSEYSVSSDFGSDHRAVTIELN